MVVAYNPSSKDLVTVYYEDEQENRAHTSFHVLAAASDANIQALVASLQAITDTKITKYERAKTLTISGQPDAVAKGTGAQFASAKSAMRLLFLAGADSPVCKATLFGPKESILTDDPIGNRLLDEADALVITMAAAAVTVMTNAAGVSVTALKDGRFEEKHRSR